MTMPTSDLHQTAAILVIGNEVLSGRTREANAYFAAQKLFEKDSYDAVITSGGIGPTHDDITMDAIAESFDVSLLEHQDTITKLHEYYGDDINSGRRRMARLPESAKPIICEKSFMPGAHIGNVYVLAGVPEIFASQLETFLNHFGGRPYIRHEIDVSLPESLFAEALESIQAHFPDVEIGSYPRLCGKKACGKICLSAQDESLLYHAKKRVKTMLNDIHSASPD